MSGGVEVRRCLWRIALVISILAAMSVSSAWACRACYGSGCVKRLGWFCCLWCGGSKNCTCGNSQCPSAGACRVCVRAREVGYCNGSTQHGPCTPLCGPVGGNECNCLTCSQGAGPPCAQGPCTNGSCRPRLLPTCDPACGSSLCGCCNSCYVLQEYWCVPCATCCDSCECRYEEP